MGQVDHQSHQTSASTWRRRISHLDRRAAIRSVGKALLLSYALLSIPDFSFVLHQDTATAAERLETARLEACV